MSDYQNLLSDFEPNSKEEWLEKIAKELKGRPIEELDWQIGNDLKMPPFVDVADKMAADGFFNSNQKSNNWEIAEAIYVADYAVANKEALSALKNGVESINFIFSNYPTLADLDLLLNAIELTYISINFSVVENNNLDSLFQTLQNYILKNKIDVAKSNLMLDQDHLSNKPSISMSQIATQINAVEEFQSFKLMSIIQSDTNAAIDELLQHTAVCLSNGSDYLHGISQNGVPLEKINQHISFTLKIGTTYLFEIARLRAFKLLWKQVLDAFGAPGDCYLNVELSAAAYDDDKNTNMIRATSMGMSAIFGGANRVSILPGNATDEKSTPFTRRVSRNLQHLFKMESYLDTVIDPAAGSYYIETLTRKIGAVVWEKFQALEKEKK